jgi:hypothetical protein
MFAAVIALNAYSVMANVLVSVVLGAEASCSERMLVE